MEQEKLLERLAQNREFTDKLAEAETFEDTVKLFAAVGVNITEEELKEAVELANAEGELDENALDNVAGGRSTALAAAKAGLKIIGTLLRNSTKWLIV